MVVLRKLKNIPPVKSRQKLGKNKAHTFRNSLKFRGAECQPLVEKQESEIRSMLKAGLCISIRFRSFPISICLHNSTRERTFELSLPGTTQRSHFFPRLFSLIPSYYSVFVSLIFYSSLPKTEFSLVHTLNHRHKGI